MESKAGKRILTVAEDRELNQPMIEEFKKAAEARGWGFQQLTKLNSDQLARYDFSGISLDYVVYRALSKNDYTESERLLFYLKKNNKIVINADAAGARNCTSDKHFQQGLFMLDPFLKDYALPTFMAKHKANVMSYINGKRVHFPILLKQRYGTIGKDIYMIKKEEDLDKIQNYSYYAIEQYVEPECDWRVFVVGGTAVGIMRKYGDPKHMDNFLVWSSGRIRKKEDDPDVIEELAKIACRTAAVSRLEYAGIDILRDKKTKKYYILETNFAAGWMNGFTQVTGVNIPEIVIDWFDDRGDAKEQPVNVVVKNYIERRKEYLSRATRDYYDRILSGEKGITKNLEEYFKYEPAKYLCDTGTIFKKLSEAFKDLTESKTPKDHRPLIEEINQMPLSWTGNFIGPETGTIEEGAILAALYLFILGKIDKV